MFGLHSPQHGGVGSFSRGQFEVPTEGKTHITYVTMVPRVGNEKLLPLGFVPCFGRKLQTKKWMMYCPGALYTVVAPVVTS